MGDFEEKLDDRRGDPGNKLSCNHFGVAATPLSLESTKLVLFLLPPSKVGENRSFGPLPFVAKLYSLLCLSALSPPFATFRVRGSKFGAVAL